MVIGTLVFSSFPENIHWSSSLTAFYSVSIYISIFYKFYTVPSTGDVVHSGGVVSHIVISWNLFVCICAMMRLVLVNA